MAFCVKGPPVPADDSSSFCLGSAWQLSLQVRALQLIPEKWRTRAKDVGLAACLEEATGPQHIREFCHLSAVEPVLLQSWERAIGPDHEGECVNNRWCNLIQGVKRQKPKRILEIGVCRGHSLNAFMIGAAWAGMETAPQYYGVDIMPDYVAHCARFWHMMFPEATLLPGDSHAVLRDLAKTGIRFDFIHVDGHHDPKHLLTDITLALRCAAPGAVMVIDDTNDLKLLAPIAALKEVGILPAEN